MGDDTVTSRDTITFRQDRSFPFVEGVLTCNLQGILVP